MKNYLFTLLILSQLACFAQSPKEEFIYPADFDKMEAVWMTWTEGGPNDDAEKTLQIMLEMAKAITSSARLYVFFLDDTIKNNAIHAMLQYGIDTSKVKFYYSHVQNRFVRDFGPLFLKGNQGHLKGIDFNFNCYGNCDPNSEKGRWFGSVDSLIAAKLGLSIEKTTVCGEGGDRDFNGKGTMMVVEAVELNRNPGMSKPRLESEYKRIFGVKKVIWLKEGSINDDKTDRGILPCGVWSAGCGGHIDDFCRFADAHTILLQEESGKNTLCDSLTKINAQRMEENYRILKTATDQDGNKFTIVRMPAADVSAYSIVVEKGDELNFKGTHESDKIQRLAGESYLNFVVANKVVLIPKYYITGGPESTRLKDEQAAKIFRQVFPGKEIVQIEVYQFNRHDGGMHCATQNQPSTDRN